jgi:hypothetical protein
VFARGVVEGETQITIDWDDVFDEALCRMWEGLVCGREETRKGRRVWWENRPALRRCTQVVSINRGVAIDSVS